MPKPRENESRADYLDRCMGSAEMIDEFDSADQRYAVCVAYWDERDEKAEGHKPTEAMAAAARRALEWRKEYGRGGTDVGVARARNIANRDSLPMSTVKRMVSFFARHGTNREEHYSAKEPDGGPTAWRIAWDLWGGDPGRSWANRIGKEDGKSMDAVEHKTVPLEVKEIDSDGRIEGYASIFGNVDQGGDIVMPGAFKRSCERMRMTGRKMPMLWQHDPSQPIGAWDVAAEDSKGLRVQGRVLDAVSRGREAIALLKADAISGLSIGYRTLDSEYRDTERGSLREIKEAELWETSLVTFPMNPEATVTDVKQLSSPREVEQLLRKSGVPGTFAKLLALHGYEGAMERLHSDRRDAGEAELKAEALSGLVAKLQGLKEVLNA